jgi:hypothetical protein
MTQAAIEAQVLSAMQVAMFYAPTDNSCNKYMLDAVCHNFFALCDTSSLSAAMGAAAPPIVLPRRPCRSLCTNYQTTCGATLKQLVALNPSFATFTWNCAGNGVFTGGPSYNCTNIAVNPGFTDFPDDTNGGTGKLTFAVVSSVPVQTTCAPGKTSGSNPAGTWQRCIRLCCYVFLLASAL